MAPPTFGRRRGVVVVALVFVAFGYQVLSGPLRKAWPGWLLSATKMREKAYRRMALLLTPGTFTTWNSDVIVELRPENAFLNTAARLHDGWPLCGYRGGSGTAHLPAARKCYASTSMKTSSMKKRPPWDPKAARSGGTAQGAFAMKELARMAQELKHEELQEQVAKMTLEGLRICEEHAKECVKLLVDAMLKALLHRCNSASAWALAAGGLEAVQRCLTFQNSIEDSWMCRATEAYGGEPQIPTKTAISPKTLRPFKPPKDCLDLQCYAWLARSIGGCRGLLGFLEQAPKFFVARLIWVLHDERCWRDQHGEEVPEAPELLKVAARHLLAACKAGDEDVIHAGVALLEDMTTHQHNIAFRLLGDGGGQIFTQILQVFLRGRSEKARATAERCARALGSLARVGRANAKELLELPGLLGQLTQLEASQAAAKRLRSALAAAERAVENIPPIMERLLEIQMTLEQAARFGGCQEKCCDALCSATRRIIWHFQPGQSEVLDKTVGIFVNQMKQVELPGADPKAFKGKLECFESLVDELGKVASACEAWRGELRKLGLEQIITARL
eukprot:s2937_g4.t1